MRYQQGAITLLITALLLVAILVLSLASYKNVFFQAKRAQNEVISRQQHWAAEGGLECAYSKINIDKDIVSASGNNYFKADCEIPLGLDLISLEPLINKKYNISTFVNDGNQSEVSKILDLSSNRTSGAIKVTADLIVKSSAVFSPADPGIEQTLGWECTAIRFKNNLYIDGSVNNQGLLTTTVSSTSFNNNGKDCLPRFITSTSPSDPPINSNNPSTYNDDILQDSTLDPFKEFFGINKGDWQQVRDNSSPNKNFKIITPITTKTCGSQIVAAIPDNIRIWVEGSCELSATDIANLSTATAATNGVLLLVHNGIFSAMGVGSFKGVLFHFNDGFTPMASDWADSDANSYLITNLFDDQLEQVYGATYPSALEAAYFQFGSLIFTGGQILDMEGQMALFNDSLNFKYNSDVIDAIYGDKSPKWLKGSWHDF